MDEDEADLRGSVCELLPNNGFEVTPTGTTDEALQALQEASFDVVVPDLTMAGGGGQEIIAAARRLGEQPATIVITGRADGALRRDVEAMGADACLQKPFRPVPGAAGRSDGERLVCRTPDKAFVFCRANCPGPPCGT